MAFPSPAELLEHFALSGNKSLTVRDVVHHFEVVADDRKRLRDALEALAKNKKLVRLKSKLYRAATAEAVALAAAGPTRSRSTRALLKTLNEKESAKTTPSLGYTISESADKNPKKALKPTMPPQVVGTIDMGTGQPLLRIVTDDGHEKIPITGDLHGLTQGEAAAAEYVVGKKLVARIIKPLGDANAPVVTAIRLALEFGFFAGFSAEAEAEAKSASSVGSNLALLSIADNIPREDVRQLPLVTIDGDDAKDFDDAVYAEPQGDGFRLVVAIADVSHYVRPGMALDREGYARGTSVYFPGFVLPMLPHALSDDLCSLRPNVDRMCFVADMHVDKNGIVTTCRSYKATMRSAARLTYRQVEDVLQGRGGPDHPAARWHDILGNFAACSRLLREAKSQRGALDLDLPEPQIVLDAKGLPVTSVSRERLESHRLIEDAMLAANSAIAREMHEHGYPAAYRVHEAPNDQKLDIMRKLAESLGYRHPLAAHPKVKELAAYVKALSAEPKGHLVVPYVLRAMSRARYAAEHLGHFALAAPDYLHFTSPIRRFPDLLVHRSLASRGREVPPDLTAITGFLSEREQLAERCEREVDSYYRCLLIKDRIGEEFEAVVISVLAFGAFVQVLDPYVDGLIPVRTIGDDYYELDIALQRLWGRRSGKSLGIGDKIKVRLTHVRLDKRQVEFAWVRSLKSDNVSGQRDNRADASLPKPPRSQLSQPNGDRGAHARTSGMERGPRKAGGAGREQRGPGKEQRGPGREQKGPSRRARSAGDSSRTTPNRFEAKRGAPAASHKGAGGRGKDTKSRNDSRQNPSSRRDDNRGTSFRSETGRTFKPGRPNRDENARSAPERNESPRGDRRPTENNRPDPRQTEGRQPTRAEILSGDAARKTTRPWQRHSISDKSKPRRRR